MTYDEYIKAGGTLSEDLFNKYVNDASMKVNALCFFRLTGIDLQKLPKIKYHYDLAVRYIIDELANPSVRSGAGLLTSESEGDFSVTYKDTISDNYLPPDQRLHIQWLQGQTCLV